MKWTTIGINAQNNQYQYSRRPKKKTPVQCDFCNTFTAREGKVLSSKIYSFEKLGEKAKFFKNNKITWFCNCYDIVIFKPIDSFFLIP